MSCPFPRPVCSHQVGLGWTYFLKGEHMAGLLWVVFLVLLVLWLIGFAVNWGAFIWVLLVLAIITLLINVIGGMTRPHW